ncbi:hypothetical protein GALMADRAFT_249209 [Galerina marginata CBS 339.88]|uniref:Zn(2)-C6 fungal-type domain-containing protein n=1 Tax=Galerina marginata (strain CBS 339.88) TaxID=685588 RepID=A0A067SYS4_GALM3|nr:hypothetical protein GALMADRAFT_249209 [Galerina marginata CBS 339.88]
MSYSPSNPYLPANSSYYPSSNVANGVHIVPPSSRPDMTQRKRPKYTRSKTGCLTCRVKKIKCDETKPNCMRCTHGSRECSWPEGVPARKKSVARRDDVDGRPSTAGSSGISEASTPPAREHSPPRRNEVDLSLLPLPSRAPSETYIQIHSLNGDHESSRRPLERAPGYANPHPPTNSNVLSMIPESSYPSRYDHPYLNGTNPSQSSRQAMPPYRNLPHQPPNHWSHPPEPLDSYYHGQHERALVGHSSPNDSHNRYQ